jgi:hypothetical protein
MKILPILLVNNTVEELPIIIYDCEKIIIEHLACLNPGHHPLSSCTLHFNNTALPYVRVETAFRRAVFYIDGIKDNYRSFNIHSPCSLKFMLTYTTVQDQPTPPESLRFLLHLSLELKSTGTKRLQTSGV